MRAVQHSRRQIFNPPNSEFDQIQPSANAKFIGYQSVCVLGSNLYNRISGHARYYINEKLL